METVSVCLSADTLYKNSPTLELLTFAVYEIAKTLCFNKITELIILGDEKKQETLIVSALFQFFITPRYLAKETFEKLENKIPGNLFKKAKKIPVIPNLISLIKPESYKCKFREGISINKNLNKLRKKNSNGKVMKINKNLKTTDLIKVGKGKCVKINEKIPLNVRVTVNIETKEIVALKEARKGEYHGYHIRIANNVEELFTEPCKEIPDGYNYSILCETSIWSNEVYTDAARPDIQVDGSIKHVLVCCVGRPETKDTALGVHEFQAAFDASGVVGGALLGDALSWALARVPARVLSL